MRVKSELRNFFIMIDPYFKNRLIFFIATRKKCQSFSTRITLRITDWSRYKFLKTDLS